MDAVSQMFCRGGRQLLGGMNLEAPSATDLPATQVQVRVPGPLCVMARMLLMTGTARRLSFWKDA